MCCFSASPVVQNFRTTPASHIAGVHPGSSVLDWQVHEPFTAQMATPVTSVSPSDGVQGQLTWHPSATRAHTDSLSLLSIPFHTLQGRRNL